MHWVCSGVNTSRAFALGINDKVIDMLSNSKVPKCVVLMAAYNGIPFISEQIDSILSQAEVDVRLFVRDDGSSDGTRDRSSAALCR